VDEFLTSVSGTRADDVWAVGARGAIVHFDGSRWTSITSPTNKALRAVFAASADDVWAVGAGGTVVHGARATR
jgi:hypothetical protein